MYQVKFFNNKMQNWLIDPTNKLNPYKDADIIVYKKITNSIFVKEFSNFFAKELQNSNSDVVECMFKLLIHLFLLLNHQRKLWFVDEYRMNFRFINRITNFIDYINANYSRQVKEFIFKNVFVYFVFPLNSEFDNVSKLTKFPVTMGGYLNEVMYIADGEKFTLDDFVTLTKLDPSKIGLLHGYVYSDGFNFKGPGRKASVHIEVIIQMGDYTWKDQIYAYVTDLTDKKLHEDNYYHIAGLIKELNSYLPEHIHISTQVQWKLTD